MEKNEDYRTYCSRTHAVIGYFLANRAWVRGLDCIVLEKEDLEAFLFLEKIKRTRADWFIDDAKQWFPFSKRLDVGASLGCLFLSRKPLPKWPEGSFSTEGWIQHLGDALPKAEPFYKSPAPKRLTELDVVSYLASMNYGIIHPLSEC